MNGAVDPVSSDPAAAPSGNPEARRWAPPPRPRTGVPQLVASASTLLGGTLGRLDALRSSPLLKAELAGGLPLQVAKAIHVFGFPAVVLRTVVQVTLAYRAGLAVDEVVFFQLDDPAGYTVYEEPEALRTALAIALLPTGVLALLALICLAPVLAPPAILHLPISGATLVQLWLGLGFAAHALPSDEEAAPLAEQVRSSAEQREASGLLWLVPTQAVALLTRYGSLLSAAAGVLLLGWLAIAVVRI